MDVLQTLGAVLLGGAVVASMLAWPARWPRPAVVLTLVLFAAAALLAAARTAGEEEQEVGRAVLVLVAGALAMAGGGPLTTQVFGLVDGPGTTWAEGSVRRAGEVLRGGAWIGVLERAAIYASILAGWPEGVAVALGVKGLGRYPELRNEARTGTAERFIIGTFSSVLWAAACAAVALRLT